MLKEAAEAVAARDAAALLREGKPVDNESGDKNTIITSSVQVASRYELVVEEEEAAGNDSLAVLAEVQILRRMIMVREMLSSFLIVPAPHAVKSITFSMLAKLHSLVESVISVALRYSFFDPRLLRELQSLAWSAQACDSHGRGNEEKVLILLALARATVITPDTRLAVMLQHNLSNISVSLSHGLESKILDKMLATGNEDFYDADYYGHCSGNGEDDDNENTVAIELLEGIHSDASMESWSLSSSVTATNGVLLTLQPVTLRTLLRLVDVRMLYDHAALGKSTGMGGAGVPMTLCYNVTSHSIGSSGRARSLLLEAFRLVVEGSDFDEVPSRNNEATQMAQSLLITTARAVFDVVKSLRDYFELPNGSSLEIDTNVPEASDAIGFDVTSNIIATTACHLFALHLSSYMKHEGADSNVVQLVRKCIEPALQFLSDKVNHQPPSAERFDDGSSTTMLVITYHQRRSETR